MSSNEKTKERRVPVEALELEVMEWLAGDEVSEETLGKVHEVLFGTAVRLHPSGDYFLVKEPAE